MLDNTFWLALAAHLHQGQVDQAGRPYISHCVRVGNAAFHLWEGPPPEGMIAQRVGFLHDAVEDGHTTHQALADLSVGAAAAQSITVITKVPGEAYGAYIDRVCASGDAIALCVKHADLRDNLDANRLALLPRQRRHTLAYRYQSAIRKVAAARGVPC